MTDTARQEPPPEPSARIAICQGCGTVTPWADRGSHRCQSGGYLMAWALIALVVFAIVWIGVQA